MADSAKITILLADEDTMRRDGLAAVLGSNTDFDVVSGCGDGQTALEEIRELRPDVAVVDLNIPGLHGIELVRRVRGESLGTKIVILAGTQDDEIVREVVRAGADAYLLKNGPARHLTDAINYVRDGGQYFSPQLGRDGRDRHLLEEPPRVVDYGERRGPDGRGPDDGYEPERPRRERRQRPRTADPARFRERIRQETSRDMRDRDYEIMAEMADGIRPILDRLDEIEGRVMDMEDGDAPVPADPRGWLSAQLADTLDGGRGGRGGVERGGGGASFSARDMDRLPELIDEAVTKRFQSMAGKLQEEIEEQHVRTLETFVKNIQTKLVQRVSVLEQNMTQQAEAMHQLHEYNQRTEDNLTRLISGVDRLAKDLPKRLLAAQQQAADKGGEEEEPAKRVAKGSRRSKSGEKNMGPKVFWAAALVVLLSFGGYWMVSKMRAPTGPKTPPMGKEIETANAQAAAAAAADKPVLPPNADTKAKLDAARQYTDRKEFSIAEGIYREVVAAEPKNVDALKGLASVLYREDKIEESADILDKLPKN